jgi:hypothetical protein
MGASPEAQISKTKPGPTHSRIIRAIYIFLGEPKAHGNSGRKTFPGKSIHTEISPLRFAPVEMTKERAVLPGRVVAEQGPFFIALVGPQAHDLSGRDDKGRAVTSQKGSDLDGQCYE